MNCTAVVDIIRRSTQGATRPFLCRCENGGLYWVKGTAAGNPALCAEWIAGRLGAAWGLPIPPIAQIRVPSHLVEASTFPGVADLGSGIRFGSRHIEGAQEYDATLLERTPQPLRLRVLAFDAWIRNTDRTFTRPFGSSGNPNLLWRPENEMLHVIDHNNAFLGEDLLRATGFGSHVFSAERKELTPALRAELEADVAKAFRQLGEIFSELPDDWLWLDSEKTARSDMTLDRVRDSLAVVSRGKASFWERLT